MAIITMDVREARDGRVTVRNPHTGHVLLRDGVLQPGLSEREAREAAALAGTFIVPDRKRGSLRVPARRTR